MRKPLLPAALLAALVAMTTAFAFVFAAAPCAPRPACTLPRGASPFYRLLACSAQIDCGDGSGSAVAFHNAGTCFLWTDQHVVDDCKGPFWVARDVVLKGKKVGEVRCLATLVRQSKRHDLAVLVSARGDFPPASASFAPEGYVPPVGLEVYHVGSAWGERGRNSLTHGLVSAVGRLRLSFRPDHGGIAYDQSTIPARPGCSGGGVFTKDGTCLGLVTEPLYHADPSICFTIFTPSRRMWEFARDADCLWALTARVAPPAKITPKTID